MFGKLIIFAILGVLALCAFHQTENTHNWRAATSATTNR